MKLIQVVPDQIYFVWQLYVQMLNFREWNIEKEEEILVVLSVGKEPSREMRDFEAWTEAKVFYYTDTRDKNAYISSIRPHALAKHFKEHAAATFFYHDQDIIFLRQPELDELEDGKCYVAPAARNYLDSAYLKSFKLYIFPSMAEIVGISPNLVEVNDCNCGGAQYVISGVDWTWWEKVEKDSEALYLYMEDITKEGLRKYRPDQVLETYHVQIWCADMWSIFWNLLLSMKQVQPSPLIDFSWPFEMIETAKPIMHNAGITGSNENKEVWDVIDKDGVSIGARCEKYFADAKAKEIGGKALLFSSTPEYFNKSRYNVVSPFGKRFDFVSKDRPQYKYVEYIHGINLNTTTMKKIKVLGVFCTTNQINADLLKTVLGCIKKAADGSHLAEIEIVTCSWEPIPDNPFEGLITPFKGMGHLNYLLQIKQILSAHRGDIVCILEHDMLYPDNYFDTVVANWDYGKYGLCNDNYIGMNETGYLDVKQRHKPFSLMSFAQFYIEGNLDRKVNECIKTIGNSGVPGWDTPYGWCCVEPDNKDELAHLPFVNDKPAIHVNMNHIGGYGTGTAGKNHHFTTHCDVCYFQDSKGKVTREDWGDYKQYFPVIN